MMESNSAKRLLNILKYLLVVLVVVASGGDENWLCELKRLNPGSTLTFASGCLPNACASCTSAGGITFDASHFITLM
jgi:hypothetical protein